MRIDAYKSALHLVLFSASIRFLIACAGGMFMRCLRIVRAPASSFSPMSFSSFRVPLLAMLSITVFVISPGNPFYWQLREGKDGRYFRMLKLRTMYRDAKRRLDVHLAENPGARAEWHKFFKLRDDPRILPGVGNFLRRSSLDELPQVINVLRGEMSLVGPRPFPDYHLEKFSPEFRSLRRSVMPGITGLWQVEARSNGDLTVQEALDTYYIRNWSIWLDIDVMFRTFTAVAQARGAR